MRVLVTNDDGVSHGLDALRSALTAAGVQVVAVVPDRNRSGNCRAMSFPDPVLVREHGADDGCGPVYTCSGSPLDCVRVGLLSDLARSADVVVSGVNHGSNLGDDVFYSGTVGAAFEAGLLDRPGIAVSQQRSGLEWFTPPAPMPSFTTAGTVAVRLVAAVAAEPLPERGVLNVNVPARPGEAAIVAARLGRRFQRGLTLVPGEADPSGAVPYRIWHEEIGEPGREDDPDTDFAVVERGDVAVSLLGGDLEGARAWLERALPAGRASRAIV